jgi:BirA family biotin operon repressor/biotin-[acetyl-CoA-carboxylase] ligase
VSIAREHILTRLSLSDAPVSGDALAGELGLSRAGVWKHIESLRRSGIDIRARAGRGYVLNSDIFSAGALRAKLKTSVIGRQLMVVDQTGSTNRDVMARADQGADEGLAIFARCQSGGKGRLGRRWHTMAGSLAFSVLVRPDISPKQTPQLSLLTAVALHEALSQSCADIRIKWPNDMLFHGAKLAGILTEMQAEPGRVHAVALGIGVNLKPPSDGWPDDITQPATDMTTISAIKISRLHIAAAILNSLDYWYQLYVRQGFAPVRHAWWQAHAASGRLVRVYDGRRYIEGAALALDEDGALLLETKKGRQRIIAGDLELL